MDVICYLRNKVIGAGLPMKIAGISSKVIKIPDRYLSFPLSNPIQCAIPRLEVGSNPYAGVQGCSSR